MQINEVEKMVTEATLRQASRLIEEAEERLDALKALLQASPPKTAELYLGDRVLAEVLERGASVTRQELYEIAERHGMDRRGLGGFFRLSGKTSLNELPGTDRIVLTPYGAEQARRHIERRQTLGYEEVEEGLHRAAEASFAEDWDSEEDSIYDSL
jgi:hypothetical protein